MACRMGQGFSLLELMVVLAVVAFLTMVSMPSFFRFLAKAKRAEAYVQLRSLYLAQKAYFAENGSYTTRLMGPQSIGWGADGILNYTYGFGSGSEGIQYRVGSLKAPPSALSSAHVNDRGFKIAAAGDIDKDGQVDILTIDQDGIIELVSDDLA